MAGVGVHKIATVGVKDGVEAGHESVGRTRASSVSLTRSRTSPGDEELKN